MQVTNRLNDTYVKSSRLDLVLDPFAARSFPLNISRTKTLISLGLPFRQTSVLSDAGPVDTARLQIVHRFREDYSYLCGK